MSDLPHQERQIGKHTYKVSMLPMGKWLDLEAMLLRVLGPGLAELLAKWTMGLKLVDQSSDAIGAAIYQFSKTADARTQERVLDLLGDATHCDGKLLPMSAQRLHWARNMKELAPFVVFGLEVQFSDFFEGMLSVAPSDGMDESEE